MHLGIKNWRQGMSTQRVCVLLLSYQVIWSTENIGMLL